MKKKLVPQTLKLTALAACAALAACGGGGDGGNSEGRLQVINFKYPGGNTLLNGPTALSATASSGLPVSYRTGTPATCTVSGTQLTLVAAGECLVIASQGGGAGTDGVKWAAADDVSQLFNVLKKAQDVTFTPPDYVLSAATKSVPLSATASSGQPVTFSSTTPAICSISGSTLQLVGKGTCAVAAAQAGDSNYAPQTTQRFIAVDPLLLADGFQAGSGAGSTDSLQTKQNGRVTANPWSSLLGGWEWCGATNGAENNADWCYRTVSADGSSLTSALHLPEAKISASGWFTSFNRIDIFAPGLNGFNSSGDTLTGLQVVSEKALGFTMGLNSELQTSGSGKPIVVHLDLGKRNNGCNVRLSTLVWAPAPGLISYALPLANFAVTDACGLAGVTAASLDNDVRTLPNPYNNVGAPTNQAAYDAALAKFAAARTSAATLLQSSRIVRVRFHLMDPVNSVNKTNGIAPSDLTIKGAITIQ